MKKIFKVLLIILFPLGIIYCIGQNLFSKNFAGFLGAIFILGGGVLLGIYIKDPQFFINLWESIKSAIKI